MNESEKQFSFTRAALSTNGRAKNQIPISRMMRMIKGPQMLAPLHTEVAGNGKENERMKPMNFIARIGLPKKMATRSRTACGAELLLLICVLPAVVRAEFTFTTNNATIAITEYTGPGGAVTIPSKIDGLPVTSMDHAFIRNTDLTSVTIPDSVTTIGNMTFWKCRSLTNISIPRNVTSIGDFAFCECSSLSTVIIPDSVTSIGNQAFSDCINLINVTIGNSVTTIGGRAFAECHSLISIKIPKSVTSIEKKTFVGCNMLEGITVDPLNSSYSSVAGVLFDKDQTILLKYPERRKGSSYTIPETVTSIADGAFVCSTLTSVTIPKSVTSIGNAAFDICTNLTGVYFKGDAPSAGDVFLVSEKATVYYLPRSKGWGTTFAYLPTAVWENQKNPVDKNNEPNVNANSGNLSPTDIVALKTRGLSNAQCQVAGCIIHKYRFTVSDALDAWDELVKLGRLDANAKISDTEKLESIMRVLSASRDYSAPSK